MYIYRICVRHVLLQGLSLRAFVKISHNYNAQQTSLLKKAQCKAPYDYDSKFNVISRIANLKSIHLFYLFSEHRAQRVTELNRTRMCSDNVIYL